MSFLLWLVRKTKTEIKIVLVTLAVLLLLPAISMVVLAASGLSIVGSALAAVNPITHLVEIFDPNGNKTKEIQLSTVWPTTGYISDVFGSHQPWRQELGLGPHNGIDIANEKGIEGSTITPFAEGTVIISHDTDDNTCGIYVKVDHGSGVTSLYCHMNATAKLIRGTPVKPGDVIGYMGKTGIATGVHTHFMIMIYDIPVDPKIFMVGEPVGTY